jgi:hypothetical protein
MRTEDRKEGNKVCYRDHNKFSRSRKENKKSVDTRILPTQQTALKLLKSEKQHRSPKNG